MSKPGVCILVLNWNGAEDTLECLNSLQSLSYENARVLVIDNGSDDDSVSMIQQAYPDVQLLELEQNLLYGGGNNAGLAWAHTHKYEYVVFLNNDTTVEPDFVEPLVAAFSEQEHVGMVAPLMCYAAEPDQVWYGGGVVNLWTGTVAHKHIRDLVTTVGSQAVRTDYITGCCLMMPTKLVNELAGFDPVFDMYGEDVDLSLRCRKAGYHLMFVPESKIYHKVSASMGGEFGLKKIKRKAQGLFKIYQRYVRWYQWPGILVSQSVLAMVNLIKILKYRVISL